MRVLALWLVIAWASVASAFPRIIAPNGVYSPDEGIIDTGIYMDDWAQQAEVEIEVDPNGSHLPKCEGCRPTGCGTVENPDDPRPPCGTSVVGPNAVAGGTNGVWYYDKDGDGFPDCWARCTDGDDDDDDDDDDCDSPPECACEKLEAIRKAMEEEKKERDELVPAVFSGSYVADSDGDGCPDGFDPAPNNPAIKCGAYVMPAGPEVEADQYALPTVGERTWSNGFSMEFLGDTHTVDWGTRMSDVKVDGETLAIAEPLESFRVILRLCFQVTIGIFLVYSITKTLRQY